MCMYVCIYARMCVYRYVYSYVHMCVVYSDLFGRVSPICMYVYMCLYFCVFVPVYRLGFCIQNILLQRCVSMYNTCCTVCLFIWMCI
jgi:hypothetical protein